MSPRRSDNAGWRSAWTVVDANLDHQPQDNTSALPRHQIDDKRRYSRFSTTAAFRARLDTYEREIERYGGPRCIEMCEANFQADSEAVLELSDLLVTDVRGDLRWRLTLGGMDRLLRDLGLSLQDNVALLQQLRASYSEEHGANRQLTDRFAVSQGAIQPGITAGFGGPWLTTCRADAFERRSRRIADALARLRDMAADEALNQPLTDLEASLLHMHANRMLRSSQRAQDSCCMNS